MAEEEKEKEAEKSTYTNTNAHSHILTLQHTLSLLFPRNRELKSKQNWIILK